MNSATNLISLNTINEVSQAAGQTGASAEEVQTAASGLAQQTERLRAEVDRFLSEIRAA